MSTWDAVWLNDEIDLLEWRIRLLREVVDEVLVVEGDRFFSGAPKPSCFLEHEARLRALGASLHHEVVALDAEVERAWDRENQQRRGMAVALNRLASPGDLVLVCDVDEVPRPAVVRHLGAELTTPVRLHMAHANYFANWVQREPWRNSAWAFRHGAWQSHAMLRVHFGEPHGEWDGYVEDYVPDAGWHLSFLGGEEAVRRKWKAYSHQEYNTVVDQHPGHLEECFAQGVHFQGRARLTKLTRDEVDEELATLAQVRADFFRFDPPPTPWRAQAYLTWTWLRRGLRLPNRLRRTVDDSPGTRALLSPLLLLLLSAALVAARRMRRPIRWPAERRWVG